jgi:hypothetical protein
MRTRTTLSFLPVARVTSGFLAIASIIAISACERPSAPESRMRAAEPSSLDKSAGNAAPNTDVPLVHFGEDEHGSPFPPPSGHDRSTQAQDLMIPRTVVIDAGGRVTFRIDPIHRVNIYKPGTVPSDINTSLLIDFNTPQLFIPKFVIDDATNRIEQSPPFSVIAEQVWTSSPGTFSKPGRYFVMCSFLPHFADNSMYGWVIVR